MSISSFDRKKKDEGYAALLENQTNDMASSHQIKRSFLSLYLSKMAFTTLYCMNFYLEVAD